MSILSHISKALNYDNLLFSLNFIFGNQQRSFTNYEIKQVAVLDGFFCFCYNMKN